MQERPYQLDTRQKITAGWKEFRKQLAVWPTGAGKTILAAHLTKQEIGEGKKVLFLAHREELLTQTLDKFSRAVGIHGQLEKAEFRASLSAPVVVGSVQTFIARKERWPENYFDLIIVDEAHHVLADSYKKVLAKFDTHARVLGITASPDRGDSRNLGEYFENVAAEINMVDLIKDGYLANITIRSVPLKIDLNSVSSVLGDFDKNELGHVLEPYLNQIAASIKQYAGDRKTLCFLPLINTSLKFVDACRQVGLTAEHIDGESEDRKQRLENFSSGKFQVLSNSALLFEGYDEPSISCIAVLRPTRSRPLWQQMIGRGSRICEGKENLLILDWLWLHERHSICRAAHLISKNEEEAESITKLIEEREAGGGGEDQDLLNVASDAAHEREEKLRAKLAALADRKARFISADEFALKHNRLAIAEFTATAKWQEAPVTDKQREWILKANIDIETVRGKGHASQLLNVYFENKGREPASTKQKWVMQNRGWKDPEGKRTLNQATSDDARKFFASLNSKK